MGWIAYVVIQAISVVRIVFVQWWIVRVINIPIRIGVNAGSLEKDIQEKFGEPTPEALLESALRHVEILDRLNFDQFKVA